MQNPIHIFGFLLIVALAVYFAVTQIPIVPTESFKKIGSYFRWSAPVYVPSGSGGSGGDSSGAPPSVSPSEIPAGFTLSQLSPLFKKIRLSTVSPGYFGGYGQVGLYVSAIGSGERVNVTGWLIKGNVGSQLVPGAVEVYDPSGLTAEGDIYLRSGSTLNIYSSVSSVGRNLRLNKCIGYIENVSTFIPPLGRNCPAIARSQISGLTGKCQDYVLSLGSCRFPAPNPPISIYDDACRTFLNTLNYRGCFDRHRWDSDFLDQEWRAWTGSRFLDERHDRVLLFDRQGLLVDEYNY